MEEKNGQSIEDNLPMVNYIMLHRIYDLLVLIAKNTGSTEEVDKMIQYHDAGYLLGPLPSYTSEEDEK